MIFPYVIGGALVAAVLVVIANWRQKPQANDNSVSIDNEEFDGTVGDSSPADEALPKIAPIALTDDNWQPLLLHTKSELPIIVEFHTTWCPGCKAQAPIFERAAAKFVGKARFFSADCEEFDHLARVGDVKKIPTTFFIDPTTKTQIVRVGLVRLEEVGEVLSELAAKAAHSAQSPQPAADDYSDEHPYLLG